MVNIRNVTGSTQSGPIADRGLAQLIQRGNLLPIVSGAVLEDMVLGGREALVQSYVDYIDYPLSDRSELHRIVKYQALTKGWKDRQVKVDYLDAVGSYIYELAQTENVPLERLEEAAEQAGEQTVSQFATSLGYPRLSHDPKDPHPLLVLANLPLPLYITTSPYTFIEEALRRAGKSPRSEFCRWHPGLSNIPLVFNQSGVTEDEAACEHNSAETLYQPCAHKPLVYHLYGWDKYPDALVLTEDDYLDFLQAIYQGRGKDQGVDPVHDVVKGELQSSVLLLLGFSMSTWDFRALYRGLIKPMPDAGSYERYCCLQLVPSEEERLYLESYLREEASFDQIYWDPIEVFCRDQLPINL